MTWRKRSTILPAYAGTCEPLLGSLPKEIKKLRTSLTRSTTRWVFSTPGSMETWMAERVAMSQHQETLPRVRVTLLTEADPANEEWSVWELVESVPPSAAPELECDRPHRPLASQSECKHSPQGSRVQLNLPALVLEVSADGTVVPWPGPTLVDET